MHCVYNVSTIAPTTASSITFRGGKNHAISGNVVCVEHGVPEVATMLPSMTSITRVHLCGAMTPIQKALLTTTYSVRTWVLRGLLAFLVEVSP